MTSNPYADLLDRACRHLTQAEVADRLAITTRTMARWRAAGTGPRWLRLNGCVRFRLVDVLAYERARLRGTDA